MITAGHKRQTLTVDCLPADHAKIGYAAQILIEGLLRQMNIALTPTIMKVKIHSNKIKNKNGITHTVHHMISVVTYTIVGSLTLFFPINLQTKFFTAIFFGGSTFSHLRLGM